MLDQGASDLHVCAQTPPRIRIDGRLVPLQLAPLEPRDAMELCYSILTETQKKRFEQQKELDISFSVKNLARFRANIYFEQGSVAGAFRIIPFKIYSLEELGFPPIVSRLCNLPRGLVLVTGPTGSGKSTTLSAMINHINETRFDHIVTIEDPIEFLHHHKNSVINQRELGSDTDSFPRALKSVLRQDPDVVLIGELRDHETVAAALTVAETGHLVFGTLHTNSAVATLNRIIDVFPPAQQSQIRTQLAMSLEAVISQVLLPAKGGGRVQALEIMRINTAVRSLIVEGKMNQIYSQMQVGQEESGMQTLNQALLKLIEKRYIDQETALSKSSQPDELAEMLSKAILSRERKPGQR
jgi:twitching motility protein PilT